MLNNVESKREFITTEEALEIGLKSLYSTDIQKAYDFMQEWYKQPQNTDRGAYGTACLVAAAFKAGQIAGKREARAENKE